jgi:hypothetical protein
MLAPSCGTNLLWHQPPGHIRCWHQVPPAGTATAMHPVAPTSCGTNLWATYAAGIKCLLPAQPQLCIAEASCHPRSVPVREQVSATASDLRLQVGATATTMHHTVCESQTGYDLVAEPNIAPQFRSVPVQLTSSLAPIPHRLVPAAGRDEHYPRFACWLSHTFG